MTYIVNRITSLSQSRVFDISTLDMKTLIIEQKRNRRLSQRISQLERDLGEGFASDADKDREIAHLTSLLKDNGIEPYGLPNGDRKNS